MICATMTEEMIEWEKGSGLIGGQLKKKLHSVQYDEKNGQVKLKSTRENRGG